MTKKGLKANSIDPDETARDALAQLDPYWSQTFSSLAKFSAVTGFVPTTPATVCVTNTIQQESRLSNFLRSLRNSIRSTSRGEYNLIRNEDSKYTMLSPEIRSKLTEHKKALVQLIKKHEAALLALRDARIQCWKSKAKIQEYQLIVETQSSALKYNQHEEKIRTAALKDSEIILDKWMATHEKDHISFETKLLREIKYRERIQKISADIKIDVLENLDHAVRTLMIQNKQNISDKDISKYAQKFYSETCRTYKFGLTENVPCQKEWIEKPKYENSIMNGKDVERKINHPDGCMAAK